MITLKGNDFGKHLGFIPRDLKQNQQTLLFLRLYYVIELLAIWNLVNIYFILFYFCLQIS